MLKPQVKDHDPQMQTLYIRNVFLGVFDQKIIQPMKVAKSLKHFNIYIWMQPAETFKAAL